MSFYRFKTIPYAHPMNHEVKLTSHGFQIKKGHYLVGQTDKCRHLFAEIPALPGVHPLSPKESCQQLAPVLQTITNSPLPPKAKWEIPLFGVLPYTELPPQLAFVIESLLLGYYHQQFLKDFNLNAELSVPINGLLTPDLPASFTPTLNTLKIKLPELDDPLNFINKLLHKNPLLKIRLDANRTSTPTDIRYLVANIPKENLEYIEDPYPNLQAGLNQFSDFPLALDKDLAGCVQKGKIPSSTTALVVKPTRDFSLSGTIALIYKKKYKVVISSAYETPIGLWPLIHVAALANVPCGLDVQKLFRQTKELSFHPLKNGQITTLPDYQKLLSSFSPIFS